MLLSSESYVFLYVKTFSVYCLHAKFAYTQIPLCILDSYTLMEHLFGCSSCPLYVVRWVMNANVDNMYPIGNQNSREFYRQYIFLITVSFFISNLVE